MAFPLLWKTMLETQLKTCVLISNIFWQKWTNGAFSQR